MPSKTRRLVSAVITYPHAGVSQLPPARVVSLIACATGLLAMRVACAIWVESVVAAQVPKSRPDVIFVATPPEVVTAMLRGARVGPSDVVYDLGSGDGRIVIAAAKEFGARGVGIEIDPQLVAQATANARAAGVADRVRFVVGDLFEADVREATVVTLYLLPSLNENLRPRLLQQLRPGARIVSHAFDIAGWPPMQTAEVQGRAVYFWTVGANSTSPAAAAAGAAGSGALAAQPSLSQGQGGMHDGKLRPDTLESAQRLRKTAEDLDSEQKAAPGAASGTSPSASTPGGVPVSGQGCQNTLNHIAGRLPRFAVPELTALRSQILASTMDQIEANIRNQGLPLANAAAMTLAQSREYERVMTESKQCAMAAFAGDGTALGRALDSRAYHIPLPIQFDSPLSIRQMVESGGRTPNIFVSCLRAFVAADLGKVATDESAVQLTCRAASRR